MHKFRGFVYMVGLALIVLVPQGLWAGPPQTLTPQELDALLDSAETAEDHLKLAAYYSGEAERLERNAERHEALATRYGQIKGPRRRLQFYQGMAKHCDDLARSLTDAAKAAQQLAESHKEMAHELQR